MSEQISSFAVEDQKKSSNATVVFVIIFVVVAVTFGYLLLKESSTDEKETDTVIVVSAPQIEDVQVPVEEPFIELIEDVEILEPAMVVLEPVVEPLPVLNESDNLILTKIEALSWRKELLDLLLTDDIVRRVVVFTDNFAQGELAYSHIPLKPPLGRFKVEPVAEQQDIYEISATNNQRYSQYIELLHSFEPEDLINQYSIVEPLFQQAYEELGYGDKQFNDVLQVAIDRVLDVSVPSESPKLVRPNVVYQYQRQELETMKPADKFLTRLGKENLLQLKAVALELNSMINKD